MQTNQTVAPQPLPTIGKSRWSRIQPFSPVSKETFRKLSLAGRAPAPERLGIRCTFYDNHELNQWLADPINYVAPGFRDDREV